MPQAQGHVALRMESRASVAGRARYPLLHPGARSADPREGIAQGRVTELVAGASPSRGGRESRNSSRGTGASAEKWDFLCVESRAVLRDLQPVAVNPAGYGTVALVARCSPSRKNRRARIGRRAPKNDQSRPERSRRLMTARRQFAYILVAAKACERYVASSRAFAET